MATVSTRLDDNVKSEAEKIADKIGIPLSTAINIFIRRFIKNKGFPFDVVVSNENDSSIIDVQLLDEAVKKAVANPNNFGTSREFTYLDPDTQKSSRL